MPNYTYYCKKCDYNHHELRKYEERNKTSTCPECGKKRCPMTYDQSKNRPGNQGGMLIQGTGLTPQFYHNVGVGNKKYEERWLQEEIDSTKKVLKDANKGTSPYEDKEIPFDKLAKSGVLKKVDKKTEKLRKKASENMARRAAENLTDKDYEYMGKNKNKPD